MIFLNTRRAQNGLGAVCNAPFIETPFDASWCPPSQILSGGPGCSYCCPTGFRGNCGPSDRVIERTPQGCVRCCTTDPSAINCPNPRSVLPDGNGCYSCRCTTGAAPAPSCPPGFTVAKSGNAQCCVPIIVAPTPASSTPVAPTGIVIDQTPGTPGTPATNATGTVIQKIPTPLILAGIGIAAYLLLK